MKKVRHDGRMTERRRGPGLVTLLAVLVILAAQAALFLGFQYIHHQGAEEDLKLAAIPLVEVREQEIRRIEEVPPPAESRNMVPEEEPQLPEPAGAARPEESGEEELVELLDNIQAVDERAFPTPPPEIAMSLTPLPPAATPFPVATSTRVASAPPTPVQSFTPRPTATSTPRPTATPTPRLLATATATPAPARPAQWIRIVDVEQNRFPANDVSDEERVLNITLAMLDGAPTIRGGDVTLKVIFYDEVGNSGMAMPSKVQTSYEPIRLRDRVWLSNANYQVTATYRVPRGFRANYEKQTGATTRYYGYRIELYHKNILQEVAAQPRTLVNNP